jgi:tRNA-specific 2-thiouridylase
VQYKERIVDYMFNEYEKGRTPNPDVLCNREIKFDVFMDIVMELGADYVATGHYCRKGTIEKDGRQIYQLLSGVDTNKDQSYFLCQLSQVQLAKALFPIGELTKPQVREIAKAQDFITAEKKDSQGLCFIGKVRLPDFLQQQLKPKEGIIVEVEDTLEIYKQTSPEFNSKESELAFFAKKPEYIVSDGKVVGKHQGAHYFTKGQRKGLGVGGTVEPLFVIDTDVNENVIYTGQGKNHPGLYRNVLFVTNEELHWVREDLALTEGETMSVLARIRYRQALENAILYKVATGLYVEFENKQSAITEGQFVAWYLNDELVGSGVIS